MMARYKTLFHDLLADESGTAIIEYALLTTIITVIAIASMVEIGDSTAGFINDAAEGLG
ncbi:MAG: hypothetical protein LW823_02175 [Rickettsiales bacterium]|jgi:Flp pilus assembly pilin Flp|nr:hypothetical protein [Rickettsiales bacterium]